MRIVQRDVDPTSVNLEFYMPGRDVDWVYVGTVKLPRANVIALDFRTALEKMEGIKYERITYLQMMKAK